MRAHGLNPRIRKSPFFDATLRSGATAFHPFNGMWMPVGYDTPVNEYWNTVERAGLWDVSVQRIVEIAGPDALAFMEVLTPRRVGTVAVGQCRHLFLCNQDGGLLNDPVMLRIAADRFWLSTADSDVYLWAKGVAVFADLDVAISTPDIFPLQIQGPASPAVVAAMFGDAVLDLRYYRWTRGRFDGRDYVISRTGFSAELGFEVYFHGTDGGAAAWERILEIGRPVGLAPGSPNRIRRIEGGVLDYGSDMLVAHNPFEMGLGARVDFSKPRFIGRTALHRIAAAGPRRIIRGAVMDGAPFEKNNEHRWPVFEGDQKVGEVSAAVHSPRLARNIGFVLVDTARAALGTTLRVETPEGDRTLTVAAMPFIDPDKTIPRGPLRR